VPLMIGVNTEIGGLIPTAGFRRDVAVYRDHHVTIDL
jgi:hypothetical protein